jgi:DNA-binding NarL/FixJ family response regulator
VSLHDAIVDEVSSIAEAQDMIGRQGRYRYCVMDLLLPDAHGFSGLMSVQHLLGPTPVAIISSQDGSSLVSTARALGAAAFILKSMTLDETAAALRRVASGQSAFPDEASIPPDTQAMTQRLATLSAAQTRVVLALADGRSNKQIARDLDVTEATVKAHLTTIFRKMAVGNRTQLLLSLQPILGQPFGES